MLSLLADAESTVGFSADDLVLPAYSKQGLHHAFDR